MPIIIILLGLALFTASCGDSIHCVATRMYPDGYVVKVFSGWDSKDWGAGIIHYYQICSNDTVIVPMSYFFARDESGDVLVNRTGNIIYGVDRIRTNTIAFIHATDDNLSWPHHGAYQDYKEVETQFAELASRLSRLTANSNYVASY